MNKALEGMMPVFDEDSEFTLETVEYPGCVEEPDTCGKALVLTPKSILKKKKKRVLFGISGGGIITCTPPLGRG